MALRLEPELDYAGPAGVDYLRCLRQDLVAAMQESDWQKVRFLDQACAVLVDRVIAANKGDVHGLISVLNDLKIVYAKMILQCKCEVNATLH